MQKYTQTGGARPFGMSVMLAGPDRAGEMRLNQVDPSGMIVSYKAHAVGKNDKGVIEILEKDYKDDIKLDEALKLVAKCLHNNVDNPSKNSEIAVVRKDKISILTDAELDALCKSIAE